MAEEPGNRVSESNSPSEEGSEPKLLGRRDALKLGAATAAAVAGAGAASTPGAAAVSRQGVTFDRVVNAVDDLGLDPNGNDAIDADLQNALSSGTLVEFPEGEYRITEQIRFEDRTGIVGVADDRSKVRFVPDSGTSMRWLSFNRANGVVIKDFVIDRLDDYDTTIGMGGKIDDNFYLMNVEYEGWTPGGEQMLSANVVNPDGVAVIDGLYRTGPTKFEAYPDSILDIYSGENHEGHMILRNIEIHNGSESGIYTGKQEPGGSYLIEDCYMKNVVHSAIRGSGRETTIRGCTIIMDTSEWDPDNEKVESTYDDGQPVELNRAIWCQSGRNERTGPIIEDCDIILRQGNSGTIAGIYVNHDTGGAIVRNTRIQCDHDEIIPFYAQSPDTSKTADPLGVELDNVSVTGESWDRAGIYVEDRPESVIRNCCIQSSNDNDGIVLDNCDGSTVENTNVNVGGQATDFRNGSVSTSGITSGDSCPVPSLPDSTPSDGTPSTGDSSTSDGSTSDGSTDSSSDPEEYDLPYRFRVESTGGGVTRFEVTSSGEMQPGHDAEGVVEGNTGSDRVGPGSGIDSFLYEGRITDFSVEGGEYANYYIETADGSRSAQVTPELLTANTFVVKSIGGGKTTFDVTVDGEIVRGGSGLEDTVDQGTASGRVGPAYGTDAFFYTGSITDLAFEGAKYATVKVNGKEIDPTNYEGGSDDDTASDPTQDLPNSLTVVGTGSSATYSVTVSEDIAVSPEETDDIAGNVATKSAEGAVTDGEDMYVYAGEITDFTLDGDATVLVNGSEVDPATLGGNEELPNTLVIDGTRSDAPGTYTVNVTGDIEAAADLTEVGEENTLDSMSDEVFDGKVVGVVETGKDGYRFSGDVTTMEINGDAVVNLGK